MRLKVEINTREHFTLYGHVLRPLEVTSRWFSGRAGIRTYGLDELLATKLRALYQRRCGRDLFDLWDGRTRGEVDPGKVVKAFRAYLASFVGSSSNSCLEKLGGGDRPLRDWAPAPCGSGGDPRRAAG